MSTARHRDTTAGIGIFMADAWQHYAKLRQLVVNGQLSVWYTMSFARLVFSVRDFCKVAKEVENELSGAVKTD
jgi:hypothetical protein